MTSSYTHTHSPAHMFPHAMFSPTIHKRADIHRPLVSFVPLPVGSANANAAERKTDDLSVKRGRGEEKGEETIWPANMRSGPRNKYGESESRLTECHKVAVLMVF